MNKTPPRLNDINIGELQSLLTLTLMMKSELISKTLVFNRTLMWLIARENFTAFIRRESFKSYGDKNSSTIFCIIFH
jgi:hypothetical protein